MPNIDEVKSSSSAHLATSKSTPSRVILPDNPMQALIDQIRIVREKKKNDQEKKEKEQQHLRNLQAKVSSDVNMAPMLPP